MFTFVSHNPLRRITPDPRGTTMTEETRQIFNDSISRCHRNPRFQDMFYEKLRDASPRLVTLFVPSDHPDEKLGAKVSLYLCLQAVLDGAPGRASVEHLGKQHSHDHETPPELYDQWLECLIVAASASDPYFDAFTEQAWRAMLRPGIEIMQSRDLQDELRRSGQAFGRLSLYRECNRVDRKTTPFGHPSGSN